MKKINSKQTKQQQEMDDRANVCTPSMQAFCYCVVVVAATAVIGLFFVVVFERKEFDMGIR